MPKTMVAHSGRGLEEPHPGRSGMDVLTAIAQRRATRSYSDRTVDRKTIEQLLEVAVEAPSAMGLEPWAFVVLEGRDRLRRFSEEVKRGLSKDAGTHPDPHLTRMLADSSYDVFHGAPALVVICATFPEAQAAEDCCLAAQNLMLAAHAAGLATCPIGLARGWLNRPETKAALGIPREYVPVFPVIVGHPAQVPAPTGRLAPAILWR